MADVTAAPARTRTVEWEDPTAIAAQAAGRSGIEFIRAIAAGELPAPPIAVLLGMGIEAVEEGAVTFTLDVGEHLYNPIGSMHGGVYATVLDSAMGCAVQTALAAGQAYTTLDLTTYYVRGVTVAVPRLRIEGTVVSIGRRVATATGRVLDDEGTLYAHGSTTCLVMGTPS